MEWKTSPVHYRNSNKVGMGLDNSEDGVLIVPHTLLTTTLPRNVEEKSQVTWLPLICSMLMAQRNINVCLKCCSAPSLKMSISENAKPILDSRSFITASVKVAAASEKVAAASVKVAAASVKVEAASVKVAATTVNVAAA